MMLQTGWERLRRRTMNVSPPSRHLALLLCMATIGAGLPTVSVHAAPKMAAVQVTDDKFSSEATFVGPAQWKNPFGGTVRSWRLRTWVDKTTLLTRHQLYVDVSYSSPWRFYQSAADDHASALQVVRIDTSVDACFGGTGCNLSETVGVELPEATLRERASTGFELKLSAKSGDTIILPISPEQINLQLQTVARYVALHPASGPQVVRGATAGAAYPLRLGIRYVDLPRAIAAALHRPDMKGAWIGVVEPGSLAERSDIRAGDVVTEYDGNPVRGAEDLRAAVRETGAGRVVTMKVARVSGDVSLQAQF